MHEEMKLNPPGKCAFHSHFLFSPKMVPFHRNVYDFVEGDEIETLSLAVCNHVLFSAALITIS